MLQEIDEEEARRKIFRLKSFKADMVYFGRNIREYASEITEIMYYIDSKRPIPYFDL